MLKLDKVSKFYSSNGVVTAGFSKVSLNFDVGEFVAITGESGSGKSTLLNVISGLDSFEEGEMYVMGQPTSGFGSDEMEEYRKRYIGNIFQTFNLINNYTVYQNVELALLLAGYSSREVKSRVNDIIKKVGLEKYRRTKASKLSGGQKQRVAIARALAKDTPIIVADEPTGNLDVESAEGIFALLAGLAEDHLIIIVTHNYDQVEQYVTRKITMHDGRVVDDKMIRAPKAKNETQAGDAAAEAGGAAAEDEGAAEDGGAAAQGQAPGAAAAQPEKQAAQADMSAAWRDGRLKEARHDGLRAGSGIRLGIRNTFSLPAKFVLLLVVSLFMCLGTTASYSNFMSQDNAVSDFSYSFFFNDTSKERVVVTKKDKTAFTDDDYAALKAMPNVGSLMKYDIMLDHTFLISSKPRQNYDYYDDESESSIYYYVTVRPIDMMPEDLKAGITGAMPQAQGESLLVATSDMEGQPWLDTVVGTELYVTDDTVAGYPAGVNDKTKISGLKVMSEAETDKYNVNTNRGYWGAYLYMQDEDVRALTGQTLTSDMALEANANGDLFALTSDMIHVTQYADPGEIYVTEDIADHYEDGVARGNTFSVNRVSAHVRDTLSYSVVATVSSDNSYYWLDMRPQDLAPGIYMNESDVRALYASDQYQASVLMADVNKREETLSALDAGGYRALYVHEAASSLYGAESTILHALRVFMLALLLLVLFFVSYFIMKLVFRSQNVYFATIRMLGGSRRGCSGILLVDMLCVFHIAFGGAMAFLFMLKNNVIFAGYQNAVLEKLREWMYYITPKDALILYFIVLGLTVLLSVRYSRRMFKKTAMNAYKEEV